MAMFSIDTNPEEFAKSVLFATKHDFSNDARYITETRALKLVCMVADELEYDEFPRGWYRHGYYSFRVHSIIKDIEIRKNLYSTKINKEEVNKKLLPLVGPIIMELKPKFILARKDFLHWIHFDLPPTQYKPFYRYSEEFTNKIKALGSAPKFSFYDSYDDFSDTITHYNTSLKHVKNEYLETYFYFSDILENILLINKKRNLNFIGLKRIIDRLSNIFEEKLYSCLPPFEDSVKGISKEGEIEIFNSNASRKVALVIKDLYDIETELRRKGLLPQLEEFDDEIIESLNTMDEKDKNELKQLLFS